MIMTIKISPSLSLYPSIFRGLYRLWECMCQPDEDVYGYIMQQADVSALRLFEALVVTLPETLLHTYVLICTDIGIKSPGKWCRGNFLYLHVPCAILFFQARNR